MHRISRRSFLVDFGRGVVAVAVVGPTVAACASESVPSSTSDAPTKATSTTRGDDATTSTQATEDGTTGAAAPMLQRVSLGFVSAYLVARGTEAAVVDTGVSGSEGELEAALSQLGLGWDSVGHVILTHLHNDHVGSLGAVMTEADEAVGYAGAADIEGIASPRPLTAVGDGDTVFGLDIIETPGHTPGHISVLDRQGGNLVVGDALNGAGSSVPVNELGVAGPNPQFTPDMAEAIASVRKLTSFAFDAVYFGHGEPVLGGADQAVADLAATL